MYYDLESKGQLVQHRDKVVSPHSSQPLNKYVSNVQPTFEGQDLEQSQHRIAYIVEIEPTRVGPVQRTVNRGGMTLGWGGETRLVGSIGQSGNDGTA